MTKRFQLLVMIPKKGKMSQKKTTKFLRLLKIEVVNQLQKGKVIGISIKR